VLSHVVVKRLVISEKDRVGIGTFQPKDEKNQDSTELTGDVNYRRIAELGIYPVPQPTHGYLVGDALLEALGESANRYNPYGEFRDAGVPIVLSSDTPVSGPDPIEAIWAALRCARDLGVSTTPGSTALISTSRGPRSAAAERSRPATAALETVYENFSVRACSCQIELITQSRAGEASRSRSRRRARVRATKATLASITAAKSASLKQSRESLALRPWAQATASSLGKSAMASRAMLWGGVCTAKPF
jgi:hypothetical protein